MPDEKDKKKKEVVLVSKPLTIVSDGSFITLTATNQIDIIFFQVGNETEEKVELKGVSSIRLPVEQLESLKGLIEQVIADYGKRMEAKPAVKK